MFIKLLCLNDLKYFFVSGIFNRMVVILIYLLQKKIAILTGENIFLYVYVFFFHEIQNSK